MISTLGNLSWLAQTSSAWDYGIYFDQTANIDASQTQYWDDVDDNSDGDLYNDTNDGTSTGVNEGFLPIGNFDTNFRGNYDGNGYSISGLTISRQSDNMGFFGYAWGANITNVELSNVNVSALSSVGGIAGYLDAATLSGSHCSGTVSGGSSVGGLVGYLVNSTISNCSNSASVYGVGSGIGGLAGLAEVGNPISESFNSGNVDGNSQVGGLVGYNGISSPVQNCYNAGGVSGNSNVGGLFGVSSVVTNSNCYSYGGVSGTSNVGGLVGMGDEPVTFTNCFWDTTASGQSSSAKGIGKSTLQMKTLATFTGAGWDFILETTNGTNNYWDMDTTNQTVNNGYPFLAWENGGLDALPVELVSFSAEAHQLNAELKWKTATETNNHGFEIERKEVRGSSLEENSQITDHKSQTSNQMWVKVGFVDGNGTSNVAHEYVYTDHDISAGRYSFRLKQIDRNGNFSYSPEVEVIVGSVPKEFALEQNYPNPFNPSTTIGFTLSPLRGGSPNTSPSGRGEGLPDGQAGVRVTLKIYDAIGREVATLVNEELEAGVYHQKQFNASHLSSGVYFARLTSGSTSQVKRLMLMK